MNIKKKKTKRLSPYGEHEIWDIEGLKAVIKYEPHKRNKAALALLWDLNGRNPRLRYCVSSTLDSGRDMEKERFLIKQKQDRAQFF